ncbi:MAG: YraN family protein [Oscillospiraceae bacterium]|jgi:putative endonuclease|nr:YraN family protein [Oscillospiraceae bacterium]
MPNTKRAIGDSGEAVVADYLTERGYCVLARNFRTRFGEIDIIAANAHYLAFVEVKTRKPNAKIAGADAVDIHKQARLSTAAQGWLLEHPHTSLQPRFDVALVTLAPGGRMVSLQYIENAF